MRDLAGIQKMNERAARIEAQNAKMIRVMIRIMRSELDYHGLDELRTHHPELRDISEADIRDFLAAGDTFEEIFG